MQHYITFCQVAYSDKRHLIYPGNNSKKEKNDKGNTKEKFSLLKCIFGKLF